MFDGRLIAIPPAGTFTLPELLRACQAAEAGGATAIQIRLKDTPAGELLTVTERVQAAVSLPVYVNDRADVARVVGVAGVHLGSDDLPVEGIRIAAPRPMRVGWSVGDEAEAVRAGEVDVDYWSCGPFFPTGSKPDAGKAIGPSGFRALAQRAPSGMPVVAIGGISADNIEPVVAAGAGGVAVISAIFDAPSVERATRDLRDALDFSLPGT